MTDESTPPEDRALFDALAALPPPQPPSHLADAIRAQVRAERTHPPRRVPLLIPIAAVLCVTAGAIWWRDRAAEKREIARLEATVAGLSVTSRYEWITAAADSGAGGERIVAALTTALLTDSSTNVRVAAAEALGRLATPSALRAAAEQSLRADHSPFVQTALVKAVSRLAAADRSRLLHALLARPDLDPVVRAEAEHQSRT